MTYTEDNIMNVELIDESPYSENRREFFEMIKKELSKEFMSCLIIGNKLENAGGYFTNSKMLPRIVLPEDTAECTEKSIKFKNDDCFGIFVHECSHYLHIIKDYGVYKAPSLMERKPVVITDNSFLKSETVHIEYEAGYRSLIMNRMYELFPINNRTILDLNLNNMIHYIKIKNASEFKDKCDLFKERIKKWKETVEKWSEIKTYEIII